jgi:FtsP/CotA-like multicopper oxidase with cupredoxin domain
VSQVRHILSSRGAIGSARRDDRIVPSRLQVLLLLVFTVGLFSAPARAQDPADQICPRPAAGSIATAPPELQSQNGVLEVTFQFLTTVDAQGHTRYCYITDGGLQAPTLRLSPGDQLIIHMQNDLPASAGSNVMKAMKMTVVAKAQSSDAACNSTTMTAASTNLHFHGLNVPPQCHGDEVVHTLIQPGETFDYQIQIPQNEPPGLYWYHPHPHGFSAGQVQGGAAGALIIEGMQSVVPSLAGLPERTLVLRDQMPNLGGSLGAPWPGTDISINYVPVSYPNYAPATISTSASQQEFWRVLNASSDTIFDLGVTINNVPQQLQIVAIDGVPVGGSDNPQSVNQTSFLLPPGSRAEFVLTTPGSSDQAQLVTLGWNAGSDGGADPQHVIANIVADGSSQQSSGRVPARAKLAKGHRFAKLADTIPITQRTLYFSEKPSDPSHPGNPPEFYITVEGQTPAVFAMNQPPNIVVQDGTTENWIVENRTSEDHIFHIHQIHFQVLEINGQPVNDPAIRDTIDLPFWNGTGAYPSVTLRMDFRDTNISGTFVYHCHILDHEDLGMMGEIQVLPLQISTSTNLGVPATTVNVGASATFTANVVPANTGSAAPTGTVQFAVDGVNSGGPVAVSAGQAIWTTAFAAGGSHVVTSTYSGDSNYTGSASQPVTMTVVGFSLSASGPVVSAAGQSASAKITVTPLGGFNSVVSLSCSLPAALMDAACSINPNSVAGGGQAMVSIMTSVRQASGQRRIFPWSGATVGMLACIFLIFIPNRKRHRSTLIGFILLSSLLMTLGCGGHNSGTPSGNYVVTVTGTSMTNGSKIQSSVNISCTIN